MHENKDYDFSGYVTRYNVKCKDGRTILTGAFDDQDGTRIPLVYQHNHKDISQVLGHMDLEKRPDGIYGYGKFNDSVNAQNAKAQLANGDYDTLSIWANELSERSKQVAHGVMKEVSLVLAGANPGAYIDNIAFAHADGFIEDLDDEAIIYSGDTVELIEHDDFNEEGDSQMTTIGEVLDTLNEDQAWAIDVVLSMAEEGLQHDDVAGEVDMDEVSNIISTLNENQMKAFLAVLGSIDGEMQHDDMDDLEDADLDSVDLEEVLDEADEDDEDEYETSDDEEDEMMHTSIFERNSAQDSKQQFLSHDDLNDLLAEAQSSKPASFKDFLIAHDALDSANNFLAHEDPVNPSASQTYGIRNIEWLFPDAKNFTNEPIFIKRDTEWVDGVLNGVHKTPFTRVKSMIADITEDEARAKGYIKGDEKVEEFFDLAKRITEPQTIYKKQKLDRDDIIDVTDFNVVNWLKAEMRLMLNEEIARAILIGDGRSNSSREKIKEANIRPIWKDDELYTIHLQDTADYINESERAHAYIRLIIKNRKKLKGSGNPTLFITEDMLTDMLLLEDGIGRPLYDTVEKLATKLRVAKIVSVPVMENQTRSVTISGSSVTVQVEMILVNLSDYNVGTDKGGAITSFQDFDIDFNQEKYLMETRMSGALVKPKAAMVLEHKINNIVAPEEDPTNVHLLP